MTTGNGAFLTVGDVSKLLQLSRYTIRAMIRSGRIRAFKTGGDTRGRSEWRIPSAEMERLAAIPVQSAKDDGVRVEA